MKQLFALSLSQDFSCDNLLQTWILNQYTSTATPLFISQKSRKSRKLDILGYFET